MNKCLLVHSGNMVVMALLSLLHLSHNANEAERIIYILKLFHETSCSTKSLVHTMRLVVHNSFQTQWFVNYLFGFSIIVQKNRMIQVESRVLALRSRLRIEVRPTENDLTRLYKNGDISIVVTCN